VHASQDLTVVLNQAFIFRSTALLGYWWNEQTIYGDKWRTLWFPHELSLATSGYGHFWHPPCYL